MGRKKTEDQTYFEALLAKLNYRKRIKIRLRSLSAGGYSIFLATSIERKWKYEFLKVLKLSGRREHRNKDNELLEMARAIRDKRELDIIQNGDISLYSWKSNKDFLEYFDSITKSKPHPCNWRNTRNLIESYTDNSLTFGDIDRAFCQRFIDYMLTKVSPNSAHVYYGTFKAAINQAIREGLLLSNPGNGLKIPRIQLEKNFLTLKELLILKDTPINQPNIKSAFLFSCFTGLRYSDLGSLEWSNIREGKLYMRQQKTQKFINTKLPETALDILETQKELSKSYSHNRVFDLPVNHYANEMLKIWIQMAGIDKKITFHCARHTYATMSLTYGIDIYTIKDCLGHSSVRITEDYVKLIDSKRDQEIDKLPKL